jgi:hypothetical protein
MSRSTLPINERLSALAVGEPAPPRTLISRSTITQGLGRCQDGTSVTSIVQAGRQE